MDCQIKINLYHETHTHTLDLVSKRFLVVFSSFKVAAYSLFFLNNVPDIDSRYREKEYIQFSPLKNISELCCFRQVCERRT
jgi:hypothetical protein